MQQVHDTRHTTTSISRFKWVIGTPYFVQGTSNLAAVPILYFIKFSLGLGDPGGQLFNALQNAGWFIKPLWGSISDRVPLFGYRRKSWFVLMALLAVVFWSLNAALVALGVRVPALFLITFNLAFATYAFVDVVCDALMVTRGRQLQRVGAFVNFQWTILAMANAGAVFLGSWLQEKVQSGVIPLAIVFLATGIPPLFTAFVGWRNIEETRVATATRMAHHPRLTWPAVLYRGITALGAWMRRLPQHVAEHRTMALLVLFIFFWKFSPSIGYIERSYLIDVRHFAPASFGTILAAGSLTFLVSIVVYRWVVRRFQRLTWYHYLYAMVALGVLAFPLSFFLYLGPTHPWWRVIFWFVPDTFTLLGGWNRYEWFRLLTQIVLGFATLPAFIIPLTLAGETIKVEHAGVSYAFLMALANATDMLEGAVGAGLYSLLTLPFMDGLLAAFQGSVFNIARAQDERTVILEIFVYISLLCTLLTLPFIALLRRELARRGMRIDLAGRGP
jgi:hypothetical protein